MKDLLFKIIFSFLAPQVIVPNIMHNGLAKSTGNRVKSPLHLQVSKSTSSLFELHQDTIRTLPVVANEEKHTLLCENNINKSVFSWVVPISYRTAWIYVSKKRDKIRFFSLKFKGNLILQGAAGSEDKVERSKSLPEVRNYCLPQW